jgi:hypothetical protein
MAEYDEKQIEEARKRLERKAARGGGFSNYAKRKLEALIAEEVEAEELAREDEEEQNGPSN